MKKKLLVLLIAGASLATMSFKSNSYSEDEFTGNRISVELKEDVKIRLNGSQTAVPPTVALVYVALAETSAAAVVLATAGAVSLLVACDSKLAPVSTEYKNILNEIAIRKLDARK